MKKTIKTGHEKWSGFLINLLIGVGNGSQFLEEKR